MSQNEKERDRLLDMLAIGIGIFGADFFCKTLAFAQIKRKLEELELKELAEMRAAQGI